MALRLAERDLYVIVWSEEILDEAHRKLLADGRGDREYCERRKFMIRRYFAEGEARDFESLIPLLSCDPKDRHVLAAAIRGGAEQIVTFDLDDFPNAALAPHDIEAIHPDEFFQNVLDLDSRLVLQVLIEQASNLKRPPLSVYDVIKAISMAGCPIFAQELENIVRAML